VTSAHEPTVAVTTPALIEACVGSMAESLAAVRGGADRLELCNELSVGGTTPSDELLVAVKRQIPIPVSAMIRPRGGSFVHSAAELETMRRGMDRLRTLGAGMFVIGLLTDDGRVDVARTRELVAHAAPLPVTFHRAFDEVRDQLSALDELIGAGVARVLTSGGAPTALEGADALAALVARAAGRIVIMAGGAVRAANAPAIVRRSSVREVHARCLDDETRIRDLKATLALV
jgi:copper homeostasis protein